MIIHSNHIDGSISIMVSPMGTAELSDMGPYMTFEGLDNPVYYFNRIKLQRINEGKGLGKELMIEVCRIADENGITILNELNPYGKRDLESLKDFFRASGFEDFHGKNTMVRRPKHVER